MQHIAKNIHYFFQNEKKHKMQVHPASNIWDGPGRWIQRVESQSKHPRFTEYCLYICTLWLTLKHSQFSLSSTATQSLLGLTCQMVKGSKQEKMFLYIVFKNPFQRSVRVHSHPISWALLVTLHTHPLCGFLLRLSTQTTLCDKMDKC